MVDDHQRWRVYETANLELRATLDDPVVFRGRGPARQILDDSQL
jgi:hypothetical protein